MPIYYRLLAYICAATAIFGAGAYVGYQYADGRHAAAAAEAQERALEEARSRAEADKQETIERVRREMLAKERARTARERGVSDASIKANPSCSRDAESLGLLMDAISEANGADQRTGGVSDKVPPGTKAERRVGQGASFLGIRYH